MFSDTTISLLLAGAGDGDLPAAGLLRRDEPAVGARPAAPVDDFPVGLRLAGAAWLYHGPTALA
jgi:hypothetical protein